MANNSLQKVIIDCSFDPLMRMEEICSLAKQIKYLYGVNVRAENPLHLILTSLDVPKQTSAAAASPASSMSATAASAPAPGWPSQEVVTTGSLLSRLDGFDRLLFDRTSCHFAAAYPASSLIYLTAESDNVLTKLDPQKIYVIGGLVDHNRMKGICHAQAIKAGLTTARLPIQEFLVNERRTVITVNQGPPRFL
jgi:tRNA (guanine9-N1)-methyltransferase